MTTATTTRNRCRSTGPHGTYWAYAKGCRCFEAVLDESRYRTARRIGEPLELVTDATSACNIARGLAAYGYTGEQIADTAGISVRLVFQLQAGKDTIRTSKDQALRAAAERLISKPKPTGYAASVARGVAARKGWTAALAWAGLDGSAGSANPDAYDETTVGLAVDGRLTYEQLATSRPDLVETVRRLAKRMNDQEIADHLRWPGADDGEAGKTRGQGAVCKFRNREGIPAPARYEAVYAYRPAGKRSRTRKAA